MRIKANTDDIYLIANFGEMDAAISSHRFDSYAMFDSVLVFHTPNFKYISNNNICLKIFH